jgi:hypothetical protein
MQWSGIGEFNFRGPDADADAIPLPGDLSGASWLTAGTARSVWIPGSRAGAGKVVREGSCPALNVNQASWPPLIGSEAALIVL